MLSFSSKDLLKYHTAWGRKAKLLRMSFHWALCHLAPAHPSSTCRQIPSPSCKPPLAWSNQAVHSPSANRHQRALHTVVSGVRLLLPSWTANVVKVCTCLVPLCISRPSNQTNSPHSHLLNDGVQAALTRLRTAEGRTGSPAPHLHTQTPCEQKCLDQH